MLSLVVIRARDAKKLVTFYTALGLDFIEHQHGVGPVHFSCKTGEVVFEIYPARNEKDATTGTRLGFTVPSLDGALLALQKLNTSVLLVLEPAQTEFGRRVVVKDFEGHTVEIYDNPKT